MKNSVSVKEFKAKIKTWLPDHCQRFSILYYSCLNIITDCRDFT